MRTSAVIAVAAAIVAAAGSAQAAPRYRTQPQPDLPRTASGTVIRPTTTILHDGYGHTRVIVVPRSRSYLDTGTEVSVGDRSFQDYMLPPGGDPGRPNWFMGPDVAAPAARHCRALSICPDQSLHAILTQVCAQRCGRGPKPTASRVRR